MSPHCHFFVNFDVLVLRLVCKYRDFDFVAGLQASGFDVIFGNPTQKRTRSISLV
jgi:hypothetical protein